MKKIVFSILLGFALQATAQTYGVGASYEVDSATSNTRGLKSVSKAGVLVGVKTNYGTFDAGVYEVKIDGERFFDTQQGIEAGYGIGHKFDSFKLSGRAAAGKVFNRSLGAPETGYYNTYAITAEVPVTPRLSTSLTMRYRPQRSFDEQKLYSAGISYALTRNLILQGTVRHVRSTGPILNGASVSALYFF